MESDTFIGDCFVGESDELHKANFSKSSEKLINANK